MAVVNKLDLALRGNAEFLDWLSERPNIVIRKRGEVEWDASHSDACNVQLQKQPEWKALSDSMRASPEAGFPISVEVLPSATNTTVMSNLEAIEKRTGPA